MAVPHTSVLVQQFLEVQLPQMLLYTQPLPRHSRCYVIGVAL
jgi:hypothetical protein